MSQFRLDRFCLPLLFGGNEWTQYRLPALLTRSSEDRPQTNRFSMALFINLIRKNVQIVSFSSELGYTTDTITYIHCQSFTQHWSRPLPSTKCIRSLPFMSGLKQKQARRQGSCSSLAEHSSPLPVMLLPKTMLPFNRQNWMKRLERQVTRFRRLSLGQSVSSWLCFISLRHILDCFWD